LYQQRHRGRSWWIGYCLLPTACCLLLISCPKPAPPKPQGPTGVIAVSGAPAGAVLTLDEADSFPLSKVARLRVSAGKHRITVECDGFFPDYQLVEVPANGEAQVKVSLKPYQPD
jgi:hypothetical protein